jgi:hypothetical protein
MGRVYLLKNTVIINVVASNAFLVSAKNKRGSALIQRLNSYLQSLQKYGFGSWSEKPGCIFAHKGTLMNGYVTLQ